MQLQVVNDAAFVRESEPYITRSIQIIQVLSNDGRFCSPTMPFLEAYEYNSHTRTQKEGGLDGIRSSILWTPRKASTTTHSILE